MNPDLPTGRKPLKNPMKTGRELGLPPRPEAGGEVVPIDKPRRPRLTRDGAARQFLGKVLHPDAPDDLVELLDHVVTDDFSEGWLRYVAAAARAVRRSGERPDPLNVSDRAALDKVPGTYVSGLTDTAGELTRRDALRCLKVLTADRAEASDPADGPHCTHRGNGERLVRWWGDDWLYCAARQPHPWHRWTGARWEPDFTQAVKRLAYCDLPAKIAEEAAVSLNGHRRQLLGWAAKSEGRDVVSGGLDAFGVLVPIHPDEWDLDPWLFSCGNAVLELRTGTAREPRRADRITRGTPVPWDPEAQCPRWLRALDEWHPGQPELHSFIQRAVGLSLVGKHLEKVLFFSHGPSSDNGKSVFTETLRSVFGTYAVHVETATLAESKYGGQAAGAPRGDLIALRGARLATVQETKEGGRLSDDLLKWLTGGDRLSARRPHSSVMEEFPPSFTLWISGNYEPQLPAGSKVYNRLLKLGWLQSFPKGDPRRDPKLGEALEAELPGILRWAVEGTRAYLERGLDPPKEVLSATAEMAAAQDDVGRFLDDCCKASQGAKVKATDLWEAFKRWAGSEVSQKVFGRWLRERWGYEATKGVAGLKWYWDLELSDPDLLKRAAAKADREPGEEG